MWFVNFQYASVSLRWLSCHWSGLAHLYDDDDDYDHPEFGWSLTIPAWLVRYYPQQCYPFIRSCRATGCVSIKLPKQFEANLWHVAKIKCKLDDFPSWVKKTICVVWILVMLSIPRRSKIQKNHLKNLTSSDGRHVTVHYADSTVTVFKMQYILICINIFGWKLAIVTQFICLCLYWGFSISTLTSFCGTEKNCFSQFYWVQFVLSKNIKQLALAWSVIMLDDMSDWGIKITHRLLLGNQMV